MASLLPYAQMLAANPPTEVYRTIMKWDADNRHVANYNDELERRNGVYGEEATAYFVGAICDLTAMSMMMVAAGTRRIEAMKASLRNLQNNPTGLVVGDQNAADRVYFYRSTDDADTFETLLTDWCARQGNSIIQLKFLAKGDWHTFAIERIHDANRDPQFIVYQSYQNVYRLKDFLGLGTQQEQTNHMSVVWNDMGNVNNGGERLVYGNRLVTFTNQNLARIRTAAQYIGGGSTLDTNTLRQKVITPLKGMLAADVRNADYVNMTGSPTKGRIGMSFVAVLMCDPVSPNDFKTNYAELRKANGLTMYPEVG